MTNTVNEGLAEGALSSLVFKQEGLGFCWTARAYRALLLPPVLVTTGLSAVPPCPVAWDRSQHTSQDHRPPKWPSTTGHTSQPWPLLAVIAQGLWRADLQLSSQKPGRGLPGQRRLGQPGLLYREGQCFFIAVG